MSRFTSLYLRVPRPKTLFGVISLQTATELISLALAFNKVTGVYGLLAILTGYQLSLLQLSTYLYSIAVLAAVVMLMPHIRRQDPFECLALAWLYIIDTFVNTLDTAVFGLHWYFTDGTTTVTPESIPDMVVEGMDVLRKEAEIHGKAVPQETATSMMMIIALTLVRVYFGFVVMAFARQVIQRQLSFIVLEHPDVDTEQDGPFGWDLPEGEGRKGHWGRRMVSYGRGYWLDDRGSPEWQGEYNHKIGDQA